MKEPRDLQHMIETVLEMEDGLLCISMGSNKGTDTKGTQTTQYTPLRSSSNYKCANNWRTKSLLIEGGSSNDKQLIKPLTQQTNAGNKERRNLNPAEYEYHRKNKLCYKCSERHFHGHVCAIKELQFLTVNEGCEVQLTEEEFFDTV